MATKDSRAKRKAKAKARQTGVPGAEVQQLHDPILNVRHFSSVDFSQLSYIMPPEWAFEGLTPDQKTVQANMDFAGVLRGANIRLIATVDDGSDFDPVLVGALLARTELLEPPSDAELWNDLYENASETLRFGAQPARLARTYEMQLAERGDMLVRAAGEARGEDTELELFVVGSGQRGLGVGKALIEAFEAKLREIGSKSYWLQTDSTCTWQWYEDHGFSRVADVEVPEGYPMPPAGEEAAGAHLYMYKKELSEA